MPEIKKLNKAVTLISDENLNYDSYALGICFDTGSRDENNYQNGISHFIEHMLFKGTRKRSARKISLETEKNGTYLNAFTSKEQTCFYARGLNGTLQKTFEILSDMILNPLFDEKEIAKEKNVILDELHDANDTPEEFISDEFERTIFHGISLANPIIGTEQNIEAFNHQTLSDYYRKKYLRGKINIIVSGNFVKSDVLALIEKNLLTTLPAQKRSKTKRKKKLPDDQINFVTFNKPVSQYYSIIGRIFVGKTDENYLATKILSIILGEGSSSRLFLKLRENSGIAYQISSFVNGYSDISAFGIYFSTNPQNGKKAEKIIFSELERISKGNIKKGELEKAKNIYFSNYVLSNEDLSGRIFNLGSQYSNFSQIKDVKQIQQELQEISLEKINHLANELFDTSKFSQVEILR